MLQLEVGRYSLCRCRHDIDISNPKYRRYRYRYPLLQRSLTYSLYFIIASKVVNDVNVIP